MLGAGHHSHWVLKLWSKVEGKRENSYPHMEDMSSYYTVSLLLAQHREKPGP